MSSSILTSTQTRFFMIGLGLSVFLLNTNAAAQEKQKRQKVGAKKEQQGEQNLRRTAVGLTGGYLFAGPGYGLDGSYALNKRFHLLGKFWGSSTNVKASGGDAVYSEALQMQTMMGGAGLRFYAWNSFNLSSSLYYANSSGQYGGKSNDESLAQDRMTGFSAASTLIDFALGNLWTLKNGIQIGADWVGGAFLLSNAVTADEDICQGSLASGAVVAGQSYSSGDNLDVCEGSTTEEKIDRAMRGQMQFYLLMVKVGYAF